MTTATLLLCAKIFFCRIIDVSCGTIRTITVVKGKTALAALVGFFEVFIWFLIVREALLNASGGLVVAISYAGGFATGTYVGGMLSRKLIRGTIEVQVVTSSYDSTVVDAVREAGFGVSVVDVNSSEYGGRKYMLFIEVSGTDLQRIKDLVHKLDSKAFIVVQETNAVYNGFFNRK